MNNGYIFPGDIGSDTDIAYKQMSAAADQRAGEAAAKKGPGFFDELGKGLLTGFLQGATDRLSGKPSAGASMGRESDLAKLFLEQELRQRLNEAKLSSASQVGMQAFS
jgi:hypothetical protein